MASLSPEVAAALAAKMGQKQAAAPIAPADVVAQAMPPLEPELPPVPMAAPESMPKYDLPLAPAGATLADTVQIPPGETIASEGTQLGPAATMPTTIEEPVVAPVPQKEEQTMAMETALNEQLDVANREAVKSEQANAVRAQSKEQDDIDRENQKLRERIEAIDKSEPVRNLADVFQTGSLGQQIGLAFSILAAGMGQGMLGAKSNVVLDMINDAMEQKAAQQKLNQEEKASLRKQVYDNLLLKLRQKESASEDQLRKSQIAENAAQIQALRDKAVSDQEALGRAEAINSVIAGSNRSMPAASKQIAEKNKQVEAVLNYLDAKDPKRAEELRKRQVITPDGRMQFARADDIRVRNFEEKIRGPKEDAAALLKEIKDFAQASSTMDIKAQMVIKARLAAAAGQLREPIVGPGAMTKEEYERLLMALGNPLSPFKFRDVENLKLDNLINKMNSDVRQGALRIGIDWPATGDELRVQKLMERGYSQEQALRALAQQKKK